MTYRLLCLDAGFTLLSPRHSLADALSGVLAQDGHEISENELRAAWEASDQFFWDEYHRPGNNTWSDDGRIEDYWRRYHGVMLGHLGIAEQREVLDRILASQFATDAWELYPDVEPMLRAVRAMGDVRIGIVSDWGSNLRGIVSALDLDQYLDFVLPSGAVGIAKPNPEFFRMALERVGVEASEAIMVGDSYRADVRGAWATGMDALWLLREDANGGAPAQDDRPTEARIIPSLAELPAILADGGPLPRGELVGADPSART